MKNIIFLTWLMLPLRPAFSQEREFLDQVRRGYMRGAGTFSEFIRVDCDMAGHARDSITLENGYFVFLPGEKALLLQKICSQDLAQWPGKPFNDSIPFVERERQRNPLGGTLPVLGGPAPTVHHYNIARPVFFRDNRYALFYFDRYCGPLCAYGELALWEWKEGKWTRIGELWHWVS